jgi:hypothetical protein
MVSFIPPIALPVRVLVEEDEPLIRMLAVEYPSGECRGLG